MMDSYETLKTGICEHGTILWVERGTKDYE